MQNKKTAIIIGAGVIGLTTAYYLKNHLGYNVTVLERNSAPGMETSHANGGQISACHATPWSNPSVPRKLLSWLWSGDSPLLFRPRWDIAQWRWLWSFLKMCRKKQSDQNLIDILTLCQYSKIEFNRFIDVHPQCRFDLLRSGIMHIYRDPGEYEDAQRESILMNHDTDLNRHVVSKNKMLRLENSLYSIRKEIVGATFTPGDMSGDIFKFCEYLSKDLHVVYNTTVEHLYESDDNSVSLIARTGDSPDWECRTPDVMVVCAASFSRQLLKPLGINVQIYPAKGYSATITVANPEDLPHVSLTDDENKLVYSRLGDRLRVAGTAELSGYDDQSLNLKRCQALIRKTMKNFPKLRILNYSFWCGLRPLTPSNRPYVCATPFKNLFLNCGHGSLGWTESMGSARLLSEIIRKPEQQLISIMPDYNTDDAEINGLPLYTRPYSLHVEH